MILPKDERKNSYVRKPFPKNNISLVLDKKFDDPSKNNELLT
jgi:hypothetical protein